VARTPRGGSWSEEYRRRIERGRARGLSRTEARGHPEERVGGPDRQPLIGPRARAWGYLPARSQQPKKYRVWYVERDHPERIIGVKDSNRMPGNIIGDVDPDPWDVSDEYGEEDLVIAMVAAVTVGPWVKHPRRRR
jgi:hypothetical protein